VLRIINVWVLVYVLCLQSVQSWVHGSFYSF